MSSEKDQAPGTREGQDVNDSKTGQDKTKKAPTPPEDKVEEIDIRNKKIIECFQKTGLFDSFKAIGVDTSIQGDKIILSGRDRPSLKLCSEKVKSSLRNVKCKSIDITDFQSHLLSKEEVVVFIDNHLGMKDKAITWEVVLVLDQVKLNVYTMFREKIAANFSNKIMACILEEHISMEESKNEWFDNMLKNESSKLVAGNKKEGKKYLTEPRQKTKSPDNQIIATATGMSSVPYQSSITNSVDQPSTEKYQAAESTDQPGLTLTGLAATTNQPNTNMLATTSNFNGGNQPTNQLSQAQRRNGTSQIAESVPGTQSDLNQPSSITNREKYQAAESWNEPGLTVTRLAATTNQPNTNMLATTSNFNGGNQLTNQLSQAQRRNGTSQIAESVPGTQSDLNQPSSITNREKYQAAESRNEPGLTVTRLAATTNQPNTNRLATASNFNGGNQPTNQLSQAQRRNGTSQIAESVPGTQSVLNQPSSITNSVDQPSTEKYQAAESTDQPALTVTGLAATTNQPNTNMLATTSNFNGGNQPTNQLSQAQRRNGTSQIAESVPGTQSDLNQPSSITNREKYQAAESRNEPGLTVTRLAATTNQPNTNRLATASNFNGGNQPTNQLSQAQRRNGTSQIAESVPGTQSVLNQPSSITNSVDQPSTEKYQAAESTDQPALTVTGLAATTNQPNTNMLATTSNFNGGNQPTNQLSQAQRRNGISQIAESVPGTQSVLNQPSSITNSVDQPSTEKYRAEESRNQPGLTVTGLAATTNQPNTNMLATTSNFNGGNQPTNQLSQAQRRNGISQIAESVPGTQSVLNQPSSITNREKYQAAESQNQPGLTVTGLAATKNQPNTNMLATTSNFNGGNQPTNQLSQAQGGNGTSQIAESVPGTQSDLNQPSSITNREKYQAAESRNQPGLTVTRLAATKNQPNTNMLATTSNFNGGNQPTNQLSQAQGGNGTSQIAESVPGTQSVLNQPSSITNSVDQPSTEKYRAAESRNQPGLTVTGLAATTNQPNTNMLATASNFNGGNQPTNQLSQAQRRNGISQIAESVPGTQSDLNQPSSITNKEKYQAAESRNQPGLAVTGLAATANQPSNNTLATNFKGGNQPTNQLSQSQGTERSSQNTESAPGTQTDLNQPEPVTCIPLSYWLLQYFEKFGWHIFDDICQKSQVKCTMEGKRLLLNGNQKSVASVKKEIDGILESLEILQEQTYCGKPFLPEDVKQKWIQIEKDKKCLITTERSEKPVLFHGWVINTDDSKMHILYMMGSITLADVDVILCPVTDKLEPIDDAANAIRTGFDSSATQNKAFQIPTARPGIKYKTGDLLQLYDTGNLKCHCLLLSVQDQLTKGVGIHSDELAKSIMKHLESSGYQSFGLSLGCGRNPRWEEFSFTLISYLWRYSSKLKYPVILYCFGGTREIFDKLDEFLCESDKIKKYLDPFMLVRPNGRECGTSELKITVEEGSILECSNEVDVIVNSVSANLDLQKGVVKKAGDTIQKECNDQHKEGIDIGDIAVTSAGNLKNHKNIFHVALYTSWIFNGNLSIQILKTLMTRCLKEAEERKLSSIAFPALGTGILGYPPFLTAKTMFDAVEEYQKTNPKYLKTVHFVLFQDKEILSLFQNVKAWRKNKKRENGEVDMPPKNVTYVEKDLETRVFLSDREFYNKLSYKELRVVFVEESSQGLKLEWDINDGCYATAIQITYSEDDLRSCFRTVIHLMEEKKLHIVDIFLPPSKTPGIPLQTQFKILIEELTLHDDIKKKENASAGKKKKPVLNYVKVVRIFLSRDHFDVVVKEYKHWNTAHEGDKPVWHFTEETVFPFRVTVVGKKTDTKNVLKIVPQDISSIESTVKLSLKIKKSESIEAKKKIEKLRKDGVHITSDEQTNQVECEGTEAQVATARQVQQAKYMTEVHLGMVQQSTGRRNRKIACVEMTEDDYAALLCFPEVFCYVKSHRYQNGQALFEINRPDITDELIQMIQSKIHELNQLTTAEVIPPNQFEDQFPAIQKQVEQLDTGIFCFLSFDKKKIIIKANGYEQVQQAKYMTEVHLGMVQQSAGRRNRKIASPDDYSSAGPSVSQSSVSDPSVKDGVCFTTKEGIRIYVYCAGIEHLEVDVLVYAANKDLQHGRGIAYHISRAAGYDFDKECDDYIRDHGPLNVGSCCLTTAGKLPYHSIIHAVGPMWQSYPHDGKQKCLDDLKMTILSTLLKTDRHHYKSIAIPSISSDLFGVPKDLYAQQYQKAVTEFSHKFHRDTTIKEIHFVDIDKGMCCLIQKTFGSEFGRGIRM